MAFYLGIDGGGSKTMCVVGDESIELSRVCAGPSNITRVGEARARESLCQAIREACAAARIDPKQITRGCVGIAGAGRKEIASMVHGIVAEVIPGDIRVVGDMEIALAAAFGVGPGVIVIAGTGSIAYGRNAQGQTARAGGWGFAVSDEGSAHWIGRSAVSSLLRSIDRRALPRPASDEAAALPLCREMLAAWGIGSFDEFLRHANSTSDFSALFPAVLKAAESGDSSAAGVLKAAGDVLADLALEVAQRLFPDGQSRIPAAVAGGVFAHSRVVRDMFCTRAGKLAARMQIKPGVVEPVRGALEMARNAGR